MLVFVIDKKDIQNLFPTLSLEEELKFISSLPKMTKDELIERVKYLYSYNKYLTDAANDIHKNRVIAECKLMNYTWGGLG